MTEPTNEQLATWIERGLDTQGTEESADNYFYNDGRVCLVCALSLGAVGKVGLTAVEEALEADGLELSIEILANILEIDRTLADRIENLHCRNKSAAEIAGMLRRGEI